MLRLATRTTIPRVVLFFLLGAVGAGPASADIYKSVGPDGKTVISNVAPVGDNRKVMVIKPASSQSGSVHAVPMVVAKAAPRRSPPQPVQPTYSGGSETLGSDVVGAVANVMGMSHLVTSASDFCVATSPAATKRYSGAALAWQQRNALVVAKKNRILSMSDRNLIASALSGDMLRMTEDMMRPVRNAGAAERVKWCDKTIEDVDRGVLDLNGRASIAPLMNYSLR